MANIAEILYPGIKLVRQYKHTVTEDSVGEFKRYYDVEECGDYLSFVREYGDFEADIPARMDGSTTELFSTIEHPWVVLVHIENGLQIPI